MPNTQRPLTPFGFEALPCGNTASVHVPVSSSTPVARATDQEALAEKDYRHRLDLRLLKELWALPRDSTPVSHICVRFGSGRLGPCPVPDAGHCGMLGAMR